MAAATPGDRARHMLDAIEAIEGYIAGKTFDDHRREPMLRHAVERNVEIVSEASRHLPDSHKQRFPDIDWRRVADLGNVLRHAYDQIIDRRLWGIVVADLPRLRRALESMIAELGRETRN